MPESTAMRGLGALAAISVLAVAVKRCRHQLLEKVTENPSTRERGTTGKQEARYHHHHVHGRDKNQQVKKQANQPHHNRTSRKTRKKRRGRQKQDQQQKQHATVDGSSFAFRPIGYIQSCFPGCRGAPRQGALAPLTRARLVLSPEIQPCSLEGIEHWSHVWLTFVFHRNRRSGRRGGSNGLPAGVKFKIQPPKHDKKVHKPSVRLSVCPSVRSPANLCVRPADQCV